MAYTITWSNGSTTEDLTDLAAGNYIVTVSAGGSCTNTASIMVANNTVTPLLIGNTTDILCFGDNTGAIDLNVGTGTAPFTYNWSPVIAGNPEDPTGLAAGNYTVTVTDDLGCTASTSISVAQPASAVQLQCDVVNEVSEPGMTDGAGSVSILEAQNHILLTGESEIHKTRYHQAFSRYPIWQKTTTTSLLQTPMAVHQFAISPLRYHHV